MNNQLDKQQNKKGEKTNDMKKNLSILTTL